MADLNNPGPRGHEKIVPIEPQPGHAQEVPVTESDLVQIDSLDMFAAQIGAWHGRKVKLLEQMLDIPEGQEVCMQIGEGEPVQLTLTGDVHAAFLMGVRACLIEFGTLPFVASVEDAPDAGA